MNREADRIKAGVRDQSGKPPTNEQMEKALLWQKAWQDHVMKKMSAQADGYK